MVTLIIVSIYVLAFCALACALLKVRTYDRVRRFLYCPWCWQALHIMRYYPSNWSSTICPRHVHQMMTDYARRRQKARASQDTQRASENTGGNSSPTGQELFHSEVLV